MATLHSYILRELLKTFGLTLAALTVLFTMGGGLYDVIRYEGISAGDVVGFIPLLIPIVVTLTMPMAALFAATMVYGRLAADNELLACRAAGINVHRLFLSVILLSIFVAAFTMLFGNFVIPGFMQRIDDFARSNVRDLVAQQLQQKGFIHRGKSNEDRYTFTAEKVQGVSESALREKNFEVTAGLHYLLITNPTFLHVDRNGDLLRFTVARHVLCVFDTRPTPIEITFHVRDGRDFEIGKRALVIDQQQIGPIAVPIPSPFRLSTADLRMLLHWRRAPWDVPRLREEVQRFLADLTRERFFRYCAEHLQPGQALRLRDEYGQQYELTAESVQPARDGLVLRHGQVKVDSTLRGRQTLYTAERIDLNTVPLPTRMLVEIRLVQTPNQDVLEYDGRAKASEPRHKETLSLDQVLVPDEVLTQVAEYTPAAVIDPSAGLPIDDHLEDRRIGLQKSAQQLERKISATIGFRLGYAASVLVTLMMGAALGVIFRGSRALAAFALALVPFFSVWILLVLGQKLTEDVAIASAVGPLITWGSLGLVLVADGVMLRAGVRR
jgi:lipopolysaccharide export LptBFGC system permease protein LptF